MTSLLLELSQLCILPLACDLSEDTLEYIHTYVCLPLQVFFGQTTPTQIVDGMCQAPCSCWHLHTYWTDRAPLSHQPAFPVTVYWVFG